MAAQQLPERPNLEQLKRQAKDLLHSAHARDLTALRRFRILPAFGRRSNADLGRAAWPAGRHSDFLSVVADSGPFGLIWRLRAGSAVMGPAARASKA